MQKSKIMVLIGCCLMLCACQAPPPSPPKAVTPPAPAPEQIVGTVPDDAPALEVVAPVFVPVDIAVKPPAPPEGQDITPTAFANAPLTVRPAPRPAPVRKTVTPVAPPAPARAVQNDGPAPLNRIQEREQRAEDRNAANKSRREWDWLFWKARTKNGIHIYNK